MSGNATTAQIDHVIERVRECGFREHVSRGTETTVIGVVGSNGNRNEIEALRAAPGVESVTPITQSYKLVSKQMKPERTTVRIGDVCFGGPEVVVIAGPCSVESRDQLLQTARAVQAAGVTMLRGGAYKPRTSPYDFQGLGVDALRFLSEARSETGLPVVGARNMQNFSLLRRLANSSRPILLKRGPSASIKEWLLAAEYLLSGGNPDVVLCERGIKTFETETRNTLDLSAVALARELSHLPVIADPSHGTGRRRLIAPMSRAAIAAGADGLIIEVHPCPERALSDGPQSLDFDQFSELMQSLTQPLRGIANAMSLVC
jgi:3-deoxy-7-phosphoheptulonate synthase